MSRYITASILVICALICIGFTLARRHQTAEPIVWYGPMPHPYINEVKLGAEAYRKNTNSGVYEMLGQEWTQDNENVNIEALETRGHRAFSIYPADAAGASGLFRAMKLRGLYVVAYGAEPALPTSASFTVATDVKAAAMTACEELIRSMGGRGNILNVLETITDVNTVKRKEGIEEIVAKYPDVRIIQTIGDVPQVNDATNKIQSVLAARGDEIDGIICTGYNTTVATASVVTEWNRQSGHKRIHAIGIDTGATVLQAIRAGDFDATIAQNTFGHGYISCALLGKMVNGWTPKKEYQFINSGLVIVNRDNIDTYPQQLQKITDEILANLQIQYLNAPSH